MFIPPGLRGFTDGCARLEVDARDVRGLIDALDARFPGLGERLRSGVAIAIDGDVIEDPLLEPVPADSEVHFLPSISGGCAGSAGPG